MSYATATRTRRRSVIRVASVAASSLAFSHARTSLLQTTSQPPTQARTCRPHHSSSTKARVGSQKVPPHPKRHLYCDPTFKPYMNHDLNCADLASKRRQPLTCQGSWIHCSSQWDSSILLNQTEMKNQDDGLYVDVRKEFLDEKS